MLSMVKGCKVHDPALLHEGYRRTETGYLANVNAENIQTLVERFIALQDEWVFLILEVPTNAKDEVEIRPGVFEAPHMDVYYLDGLSKSAAIELVRIFAELFIHDGMSRFGIGSHSGNNEIIVDFYNVVTIYTKTPEQYSGLFESLSIMEATELKTAWYYFTEETPGECCSIYDQGRDIYDAVDCLKQNGLYFAERREKFIQQI